MYKIESAIGAKVMVNGHEMDYFIGTGYFGLQGHTELIDAACEATRKYGIGRATSIANFGHTPLLDEVEERAANFFGTEQSLYYASGYLGNAILLKGLKDEYDIVFVDKESHYSVFDGIAAANKPLVVFNHLDANDLKNKIEQHLKPNQRPLIFTDGVFSVTGKIAPIPDYISVLEKYKNSIICVDDAHATGVLGKNGRGTFEYFGLNNNNNLYASGTMSKAFGGHGGIISGKKKFIEKIKVKSEIPYATNSVPIPAAAATVKALQIIDQKPEIRTELKDKVKYAKNAFRNLGFKLDDTPVPIICLSNTKSTPELICEGLLKKNIIVSVQKYGTYSGVPVGGAIRIAIFSTHSMEQIDKLTNEISKYI